MGKGKIIFTRFLMLLLLFTTACPRGVKQGGGGGGGKGKKGQGKKPGGSGGGPRGAGGDGGRPGGDSGAPVHGDDHDGHNHGSGQPCTGGNVAPPTPRSCNNGNTGPFNIPDAGRQNGARRPANEAPRQTINPHVPTSPQDSSQTTTETTSATVPDPEFFCYVPSTPHARIPNNGTELVRDVLTHADPNMTYEVTETVGSGPPTRRDMRDLPASSLVHEMTHVTNSWLECWKNSLGRTNGDSKNYRAFYLFGGRAMFVPDPGVTRTAAAALVPPSLRAGRFQNYFNNPGVGYDGVTYIYDEWTAYINGAEQSVGSPSSSDPMTGPLEFFVYALAGLKAVHDQKGHQSQEYLRLKALFAYNSARVQALFPQLASPADQAYLQQFQAASNTEAQPLRAFLGSQFQGWSALPFFLGSP